MSPREFSSGSCFQIPFESSRLRFGVKGDRCCDFPWSLFRRMRALSAVVSLESVLKIAGHTRVVSPQIEFANENVNVVKLAGKRGIVAILSPKWLA